MHVCMDLFIFAKKKYGKDKLDRSSNTTFSKHFSETLGSQNVKGHHKN